MYDDIIEILHQEGRGQVNAILIEISTESWEKVLQIW
jgi:hypothetical protein